MLKKRYNNNIILSTTTKFISKFRRYAFLIIEIYIFVKTIKKMTL